MNENLEYRREERSKGIEAFRDGSPYDDNASAYWRNGWLDQREIAGMKQLEKSKPNEGTQIMLTDDYINFLEDEFADKMSEEELESLTILEEEEYYRIHGDTENF